MFGRFPANGWPLVMLAQGSHLNQDRAAKMLEDTQVIVQVDILYIPEFIEQADRSTSELLMKKGSNRRYKLTSPPAERPAHPPFAVSSTPSFTIIT